MDFPRLIIRVTRGALYACVAVSSIAFCESVSAEEGMWLPQELPRFVLQDMESKGCAFQQNDIFNSEGTGIANAVVRVGATGTFVSPDGLVLTNHHVAFGAVQRMSTPDKNYISQGFLARSRTEEVPAIGYFVYVTQSVEDVTEKVLSAAKPSMTPIQRYYAIERRTKELVKKAESKRDTYAEVRGFSGGVRYLLYSFLKIRDVRVVYVPSRSIGEYGGEIDNWMWPRHTGDFSFLRAYVAPDGRPAEFSGKNVPYRPKRYLKVAPGGAHEGDLTIVIGFPGGTHRYLTSYAMAEYESFAYPQRVRLSKEMAEILEQQSAADPVASVRVASTLKGIYNNIKDFEGILEGFKRFRVVDAQQAREREIASALRSEPEAAAKFAALLEDFKSLYEKHGKYDMRDLLLGSLTDQKSLLAQAMFLYKWSVEKEKRDMDREPEFMERRVPDMKRDLSVFQTQMHLGSERAILKMLLLEIAELPVGQRMGTFDAIFGSKPRSELQEVVDLFLDGLYANTKLDREDERLRLFELSRKKLLAENDAFLTLAGKLYEENQERLERDKEFSGTLEMLMPKWIETVARVSERELYPDANGTMRFNYGQVKGYSPRDAVVYSPFTTLEGVIEKHTGARPFDCPGKILELAAKREFGPYSDPDLGDVAVNLLTTNDSTRGNSGSPVLNAKGELVGCLFDGNYEGLGHDFAFHEEVTRSIHVDIRYVLWVADFVDDAQNVLQELGVK